MYVFLEKFRSVWERPDGFVTASIVTLFIFLLLLLPAFQLVREGKLVVGATLMVVGILFLNVAIAMPTGRPLPAIDYGRYSVVQMQNTGSALFIVASRSDRPFDGVRSWFIRQRDGTVGWDLPLGSRASDYTGNGVRLVRLCVGESPEYRTFITDCVGGGE